MSRTELIEMARESLRWAETGRVAQTEAIRKVPAEHYFDEARWRQEMRQVFQRVPLMLAMTAELPEPGDYKSMLAVNTPVLITRGQDGKVRAFINMCRHRGAQIMAQGTGKAKRFTCPYHAWTYDDRGALVKVFSEQDFGSVDRDCNSLVALPAAERAGLIWVMLNPNASLDIDDFLSGYDRILEHFNFADWHFFERRTLKGPNWKVAYDGYLDLYHLPILHRNTFGADYHNQALYRAWGPHQRVTSPDASFGKYNRIEDASDAHLMSGVWTIFPHVSIASFDGGGRGVMISQLFPGETALDSYTVQNYLMEKPPADEAIAKQAHEQFKFLEYVVREEDYATGLRLQQALRTGGMSHVQFGRNEGGGQCFHSWLDKLLETDDQTLPSLFAGNGQDRGNGVSRSAP